MCGYIRFSHFIIRSTNGHKCWYILANQNAIKATIFIENYNEVLIHIVGCKIPKNKSTVYISYYNSVTFPTVVPIKYFWGRKQWLLFKYIIYN